METEKKQKENQKTDLMSCIENLCQHAGNFFLDDFFEYFKDDASIVAEFLDCTLNQAVFFCAILDLSLKQGAIEFREIASKLGLSPIKLTGYFEDFEYMERTGLICKYALSKDDQLAFGSTNWYVPNEVFMALRNNDKILLNKNPEKKHSLGLIKKIVNSLEYYQMFFIDYFTYYQEVDIWLFQFEETKFAKACKKSLLKLPEIILLANLSNSSINGYSTMKVDNALEGIFSSVDQTLQYTRDLLSGNNELEKLGYIKLEDGYYRTEKYLSLTQKAIDQFLDQELAITNFDNESLIRLIQPEDIKHKKLFFDNKEKEQLDFISNLLNKENQIKLQERLKKNGLPEGLVVLLHGVPGTGKTEWAHQIAKQTGRALYPVDVADIREMYYGQSEKHLRKLFKEYNNILDLSVHKPIMLFNEGDQLICKRMEVYHSIDQTANSLQSILLEELESTKGIVIITTNMIGQIDHAFHRRFLFKVKFNQPSFRSKVQIWREKIKGLKMKDAEYLAKSFDFSGGDIMNISSKVIMDHVLKNKKIDLEKVVEFCLDEKLTKTSTNKIGF